ncbi:hypothetical protein V5E97_33330 [Singulisphaera sp. Ch08]|uniref:PEP-CTERM sorting domain-containing protein n=1 Tax=Singulisphaera sp. Ch08 TaxID=3120278 RepID=A0AAU7CDG8_9BACT
MKPLNFVLAAVVGLFISSPADAAITLGLSSVENASIQFTGTGTGQSTISFNNGSNGNSFAITTVAGSPGGSPAGLFGSIAGSFTYSVATIISIGALQIAPLGGSAVLSIGSAGGPALTATITGIALFSLGSSGGSDGLASLINLSNVSYSGSNIALLQLKNEATAGGGVASISYQFGVPKNLTNLAAAGTTSTTFSGTVTTINSGSGTTVDSGPVATVPEPGSLGMAFSGVALLSLGYYRQRRRRLV